MELTGKYNENQIKAYIYDNRYKIGSNLLDFIKDNGYTKSSISKLTGISRAIIDKLIKGEIDNNTTLKSHIDKIVTTFNIDIEQLINYKHLELENTDRMVAFDNSLDEYEVSDKAKKMFNFLNDIVDLYEVYSDR
ncbi:helix-turn-helix transcriptional regulator [Clostridium sp. P21]|uniref:Helix-turn-helix transcriptional regulator n=1 Tax=Clostridium muellerianum TaxID=2716538 RepID=A0A7Y0HRA1_9CLOT|nr:helix-turn-helix transcriptional regulator [Clostridium muellerianum]NMM64638.1 helix-turn-helix transcriptional regulator [Clostridium muellerianum]